MFRFNKKGEFIAPHFFNNYLLQMYIVTSKPKRISVADGVVHIAGLLSSRFNKIIPIVLRKKKNGELEYANEMY
jgi:hypothetical protein